MSNYILGILLGIYTRRFSVLYHGVSLPIHCGRRNLINLNKFSVLSFHSSHEDEKKVCIHIRILSTWCTFKNHSGRQATYNEMMQASEEEKRGRQHFMTLVHSHTSSNYGFGDCETAVAWLVTVLLSPKSYPVHGGSIPPACRGTWRGDFICQNTSAKRSWWCNFRHN